MTRLVSWPGPSTTWQAQITTLLSAERRLLQDVSHELRSPLARLGFAVELARTSPDREAALGRVRKEADRLHQLVNELMQLTAPKATPPPEFRGCQSG